MQILSVARVGQTAILPYENFQIQEGDTVVYAYYETIRNANCIPRKEELVTIENAIGVYKNFHVFEILHRSLKKKSDVTEPVVIIRVWGTLDLIPSEHVESWKTGIVNLAPSSLYLFPEFRLVGVWLTKPDISIVSMLPPRPLRP